MHLYGSSRLGLQQATRVVMVDTSVLPLPNTRKTYYQCGFKLYEQSNHLGNVLVTLTDKQRGIDAGSNGTLDYYLATVQTATHYYPFGWELVGMQYGAGYRYGYNGMEKSPEIGSGHHTTFFRENDSRSPRWWSVDPKTTAGESPYVMMGGNPILFADPLGDEIPVKFYNRRGRQIFQMPRVVKEMFESEYGISVHYNRETGNLVFAGNTEYRDEFVNQNALSDVGQALAPGCITSTTLHFGYDLAIQSVNTDGGTLPNNEEPTAVEHGITAMFKSGKNAAFIDLADFDQGGRANTADAGSGLYLDANRIDASVLNRNYNIARIFEHEFFLHGEWGASNHDKKMLEQENRYRGGFLPIRLDYGATGKQSLVWAKDVPLRWRGGSTIWSSSFKERYYKNSVNSKFKYEITNQVFQLVTVPKSSQRDRRVRNTIKIDETGKKW